MGASAFSGEESGVEQFIAFYEICITVSAVRGFSAKGWGTSLGTRGA